MRSRTFRRPSYLPNDRFSHSPLSARYELEGTFDSAGILLFVSRCPNGGIVEVAVS
ncbi:Bgt-20026 [Blumeria graminis f. sp. tritici]|uniref:Bgt-20026 n=2 Tax=Blumeria graminis f. sp. tritici TaxID=62690 RepID=A0A9X9LA34_BLUGR|nr:Bgt-20026 [Blumeria graminis f. sp. tritici]